MRTGAPEIERPPRRDGRLQCSRCGLDLQRSRRFQLGDACPRCLGRERVEVPLWRPPRV